ncbi:hypothetical protein [Terriglobus tenax]|uniref:hypothetical protein n=1 Tax=Terriglobus tenax TaxID=1111115 RepID=UPI0021E0A1C1|nr:hypothetical protein [Terriglobus tenax]
MHTLPSTHEEMEAFIAAFEAGTLPKERWTHGAHILGGAWYVHALGADEALTQMRQRIRAYNEAVGGKNTETSGYHETITVFWILLLAAELKRHPHPERAQFANHAVSQYAPQREILTRYYSFDVVKSVEARRAWVAPDLQEIG